MEYTLYPIHILSDGSKVFIETLVLCLEQANGCVILTYSSTNSLVFPLIMQATASVTSHSTAGVSQCQIRLHSVIAVRILMAVYPGGMEIGTVQIVLVREKTMVYCEVCFSA